MRTLLLGLALLAAMLAPATAAAATEKRVALVIGNNDYKNVTKLVKAVNDATAVKKELERVGFEVIFRANATQRTMNQAVNEFAEKVAGGGVGVFFFAGHGLQINNVNYLVPVDMELPRGPNDVDDQTVSLQRVQDKLADARAKFSLLVIDACRDNPLPQKSSRGIGLTRGLAQASAPNGQVILFSAGANEEALDSLSDKDASPNGLFTREFLPLIGKPGLSVSDALKKVRSSVIEKAKSVEHDQHPALYDQSDGDFYFVSGPAPGATPAAGGGAVVASIDPSVIELEYWKGAQQANTAEAYQSYLNRYPKGQYAELATANIRKLKETAPPAKGGGDPVELALWDTVNDSGDVNEYKEYLRQFPNGRFAAIARNRIQSLTAKTRAGATDRSADAVSGQYSAAAQGDKTAFAQLRRSAEQGSALAQAKLGAMYEFGQGGLQKDPNEALKWYRKAAAQGNAQAQASLGLAYATGRGGVTKDETEAAKWFRRAAEQGDERGQSGLGYMYLNGRGGLPQDDAEAVRWYRKAAEQGRAAAQYHLGLLYAQGRGGLAKDDAEAQRWLRKAADQGHTDAAARLKDVKPADGRTVDQIYAETEGNECKGKPFRFLCQSSLKAKLCSEHNAYGQPGASICPSAPPANAPGALGGAVGGN